MIGIYIIKNLANGKVYIGQSTDIRDRLWHHKSELKNGRHPNTYLQRSWDKYGRECFSFEVLEECHIDSMDKLERYYIKEYNSMNRGFGYNRESGGHLLKRMSIESRQKMSISKIGVYAGEKNPMYGRRVEWTEERRRVVSEKMSGKNHPSYGKSYPMSPELKKWFSERFSGEGNPFYGKKHSDEARAKISASKKKTPVRCVETGISYESANHAQRETGIHSGSIIRSCRTGHILSGGFHWEFVI